jgi:hypothetical protein
MARCLRSVFVQRVEGFRILVSNSGPIHSALAAALACMGYEKNEPSKASSVFALECLEVVSVVR